MRRRKFERVERIEPGERGPTGDKGDKGEPGENTVVYDEGRERERDRTVDAAERKRDRKAFKDAAALLAVPVSIIMVAALLGMGYGIVLLIDNKVEERERTTYAICQGQKANRDRIRNEITGGDPMKLQPGDYGYSYARDHPIEAQNRSDAIARAIELSERDPPEGPLANFPPIVCLPPGGKPEPVTTKETP
jgi:hypothetical protein